MANIPITVNLNDNWIPSHFTQSDPKLQGMYAEMPMSIPLSMTGSMPSWDNSGQYASAAEPKFAEMNTVNTQVLGDILLQAAQNAYIFPDYAHQPSMINNNEMKLKKDLDESKERINHLDKTIKTLRHEVRRQSRHIISYKQLFNSIATERQLFRAFKGRSVVHLNSRFMGRTLALIPNQRPLYSSGSKSGNKLYSYRKSAQQAVSNASKVSELISRNLDTMFNMLDDIDDSVSLLNKKTTTTPVANESVDLPEPVSQTIKGKSPFTCFECDKTFSRKGHLKRHILKIHEKNRAAAASLANIPSNQVQSIVKNEVDSKVFQSWSYFNRPGDLQNLKLSYMPETPFKCEICKRFFKTSFNLKTHQRTHFPSDNIKVMANTKSKEKPHKCKYCHETFTYISQRDMHQKEHTGENPLKCSYCTKTFSIHCNLRAHERVHTGEKPFQCRYCPKAFVQVSHRNCHERTHTGERPYQCALCSRAFAVLGNLKSHQQTHNITRPRPHNCNVCSKAFFTPRSLKTHVKTHQLY